MARQVGVKLDLDAAAYLAEAKAVEAETKSVDDKMKALGREIDATGHDMDQLAVQAAVAKKEVKDLGDKARGASDDLKLLDTKLIATKIEVKRLGDEFARTGDEGIGKQLEAQKAMVVSLTKQRAELVSTIDKTAAFEHKTAQAASALKALDARILSTKALIHDLGVEFANTGEKATSKELGSQRSLLGQLTKLRKELTPSGPPDLLPNLKFDLSGLTGSLMPALIGVAVAAAPTIGAVIGGAVIGAVGLGGIAGGIVAAAGDPRVKDAWKGFTGGLGANDFGREAFVKPVISGIAEIQAGFKDLKLGDALSKGAVAVPILAAGVSQFANNIMPGFNAVMTRAEDIANVFSDGLGSLGGALGSLIFDIARSKGSMDGLRYIFVEGSALIKGAGSAVASLGDGFHSSLQWIIPLGQHTADFYSFLGPVHDALQSNVDAFKEIDGQGQAVDRTITGIGDATIALNMGLDPLQGYLQATWKNFDDLNKSMDDYLSKNLNADRATLAFKDDILQLKESVNKHGTSLKDNTRDGLDNQKMIQGLIGDAQRVRDATYAQTGSVQAADAAYKNQIDTLTVVLQKLGFTKKQIDSMVGDYHINVITQFVYNGYNSKLTAMMNKENRFDNTRAAGGPVAAGKTYLVGEEGPEIFTAETSGHIIPNGGGWQSASGGSGWQTASMGGGGGATQVALTISAAPGSDARVMAAITESLRFDVRTVSGGSAQVHFAPRGRN